ncbi:MAG: magnesium transporter, partial [Planctomycetota bacterium]
MEEAEHREPWVEVEAMVQSGDADQLDGYLHRLPPGEPARVLSRLGEERRAEVVGLLAEGDAAALLTELSNVQAAEILEHLSPDQAAAIVSEVKSNQQADLLGALETERTEAILDRMAPQEADDLRRLVQYAPDTAAGLMVTEYLAFGEDLQVEDVMNDLREN